MINQIIVNMNVRNMIEKKNNKEKIEYSEFQQSVIL